MKNYLKRFTWPLLVMILVFIIAGCSATKMAKTPASPLKYKFSGNDSYVYSLISDVTQSVDIGGQEMGAKIYSYFGFQLSPGVVSNGRIPLNVIIDSVGMTIQSPQGNIKENLSQLEGKEFDMTLTELGKEQDLDAAEQIKFLVAGQESNLKGSFLMMFPDLPESAFTEGATWTDNDSIDMSTGTDNVFMIMKSENVFGPMEDYKGYKCIRINSVVTGSRTSVSNTPQGQIGTEGDLKGKSSFLFAPEEGILVWSESDVTMEGFVSLPTGDAYPLLVITKYTSSIEE